ncbi:MAG: ribonucleoside-triphosphate reductase [Chloroflexi bacterium]|nr:ribonucleoside-triphosphate reductase [Chloroflexota bacterium]
MVITESSHSVITTSSRSAAAAKSAHLPEHGRFPNELAEFVFVRTYARWDPERARRETWEETVERVIEFLGETAGPAIAASEWAEVREALLTHGVRPSSRLLAMAGKAARVNPITAYNCSYLPIDSIESFAEILYILMAGTGVGFSVERRYVQQLPVVAPQRPSHVPTFVIPDDTEGWADALKLGLTAWFAGQDVTFDYHLIRPAGAPLQTKGGRASGPEPLRGLLDFTRRIVLGAQGRQLTSLECHDIATKIGDVVVMGGVRRSAEISLSDFGDVDLRHAKDGQYWITAPHRSMANNSAVYESRPSWGAFLEEWNALSASGTGERGIFNRQAARALRPSRRPDAEFGTNPCGEITLRPYEFCNLSEVVARSYDTPTSLRHKIRLATLIGTVQSMLTSFPYLRPQWRQNCEEERLLGVSVTGQLDCPVFWKNPALMAELRDLTIAANAEYAQRLGINPSAAVTCVKPSGNASQMADCASGMHPRFARYYVRRVRVSATDPLYRLLHDAGVPLFPEVGQQQETATTWVVEFPVKAPDGAITRHDMSALEQLEYWLTVKVQFTEHNPSQTIYVGPDEWDTVGRWVYDHWDEIGGLSFLPRSDHVYRLAPYEDISEQEYQARLTAFPKIDYRLLATYELEDRTESTREFACTGDRCEIL